MSPSFKRGSGYDDIFILDRRCLRFDTEIGDNYTLTIFVNDNDIYFEVEKPNRLYFYSKRFDALDYITPESLEALLNENIRRIINMIVGGI